MDPARTAPLARLAELAGDLLPTADASAEDLATVRRHLAASLRAGADVSAGPLDAGSFASVDATALAARRPELAALLAEAPAGPPTFLVHRRDRAARVVAPATAAWAVGRAVAQTLGPFVEPDGGLVWFDLFRVVSMLRLVRASGAAPFAVLSLHVSPLPQDRFAVDSGSLWIASGELAPDIPAGSYYTGLRVQGGTLSLGQPLLASATELVVPPGTACTLEVDLDPPDPPAGSGPGADAREATVTLPPTATFTFGAPGAAMAGAGDAALEVYGVAADLRWAGAIPSFLLGLGEILVPFGTDTATFAPSDVRSTLFWLEGTAPIIDAAWALPVAAVTADVLGEASGAGALALLLDGGLRATWQGHDGQIAVGPSMLLAEPGMLTFVASSATARGQRRRIDLWPTSRLDLSWPRPFSLRAEVEAAGTERLVINAELAATFDRPLTVSGERLPLVSRVTPLLLTQTAAGTELGVYASPQPPAGRKAVAFALANAVIRAAPLSSFSLDGPLVAAGIPDGTAFLRTRLDTVLPTLPDPYGANHAFAWRRMREVADRGPLTIRVDWESGAEPTVAVELPENALGGVAPLPRDERQVAEWARREFEEPFEVPPEFAPPPGALSMLDLSTNVDQFGVGVALESARTGIAAFSSGPRVAVEDLHLVAPAPALFVLTAPAVQWEPVLTPDDPSFPSPMSFPNNGGPTLLHTPTQTLVPVAPRPALGHFVARFAGHNVDQPGLARFTLPFGIVAVAALRRAVAGGRGAHVDWNRPRFASRGLQGGHQISLLARGPALPGGTAGLDGATVQLANGLAGGVPTGKSVLGMAVETIFNDNFTFGGTRPGVPVTRIDISGYGESLFSDWRNPEDAAAVVSQARFDVLVGRTAYEVIQVRTVCYPFGPRFVRTITIERRTSGPVTRHDSGWVAVTEGRYLFPSAATNPALNPSPGIKTHPGIVRGIRAITAIRDTGQTFTTTLHGTLLMAVRYNGVLDLDGAGAAGVPVRDQIGWVQLTDPALIGVLDPAEYAELIAAEGPMGGPADATVGLGGPQRHRVAQVGVGFSQGPGGPEFAMAAWGSPVLPGGGQWSVMRAEPPEGTPQPVDAGRGVPLVRAGLAPAGPAPTAPYRFADPVDLLDPTPLADYGWVHATGTQRAFFPRPVVHTATPDRVVSDQRIAVADPYALSTAPGFFPPLTDTIPIPDPTWGLRVAPDGAYRLELAAPGFPVGVGLRVITDAAKMRTVVDYSAATLRLAIDTAAPVPWSFRLEKVDLAVNGGSLGEVIRVRATVDAAADRPTRMEETSFKFGGALSLVQDIMEFLKDLGLATPLPVSMSNKLKVAVGGTIDLQELFDLLPLPPAGPKFEDCSLTVKEEIDSPLSKAEFAIGGKLFVPTTFPPLMGVGVFSFTIKMESNQGNTFVLLWGAGVGVHFKVGGFGCVAVIAVTNFLIIGDNVIGVGAGVIISGSIDLEVIEVGVSLEAKMALLRATCPAGASVWGVAQVVFAVEVTIAWVLEIEFEIETEWETNFSGGPCPLPDVL